MNRICTNCKIRWSIKLYGRDCPKCKIDQFFTMNEGDIGTAIYFEHNSDDRVNYKIYGVMPISESKSYSKSYPKLDELFKEIEKENEMKNSTESIFAIKDRFHPHVNGDNTPEIRSDNESFANNDEFIAWCKQHGANLDEIYRVK